MEIAPKIEGVSLIYNRRTSPYQSYLREFDATARQFGISGGSNAVLDAVELEG